ncbi:SCP-like extracellular protein [Colletotrichum graminicola]|uniref:SCP-like extracellular protein n=1 Tax=Colletotrichum graminicola (strain M1.001 / M2 / FGSC 10212) TaxID=645133 RepID=E3QYJ5_COLGM|nr:SCP-like extracellular protein [Colletotrichum graminicola M1.001]EFQ35933.1 SCP-like extracellular protein [Colletotrichum graminicola M1.001]WDK14691.1 SCP-like extracellular protein [Colletotrichum graminicola]
MFTKAIITAAVAGLTTLGAHAEPLTTDQDRALKTLNDARIVAGVHVLDWNTTLQKDATAWARKIAAAGYLERAPASLRNGAGEVVAFFQALDAEDSALGYPLSEAAKLWLNSGNMARAGTVTRQEALSKTEHLLSLTATDIGCGTAHGTLSNGAEDPLRVYAVCRIFEDVSENIKLSARQNLDPGPFWGDLTFFNPGLGACGRVDSDGSMIVALSHLKMGSQSNSNPLCGRQVRIRGPRGEAIVTVADKCMGCSIHDIDVSPAVFEKIAGSQGLGRVGNIEWSLI